MPIDSFGYQVMSLDEVIEGLQKLRRDHPATGGQPVWIGNSGPVRCPIKCVELLRDGRGVQMFMERG